MATAKFAETAEHSVTCPICFEFFVDPHVPKDLKCPHTCCQVCLQYIVTLNHGQPITCPMKCKQKTRVPAGGVEKLRTNLHVKNLAEEHPNYVKGAKSAVPKCTKHQENMHLYCTSCNMLACHSCGMAYHKGAEHVIVDVRDTTEEQKKELETVVENTMGKIESCHKSATELKELETNILRRLEKEQTEIDKNADACYDAINKERKRLKSELKKANDVKLNELRKERTQLENRATRLQAACDVAIKTGETSDHAYITQHEDLVEKMKKMTVKDTPVHIDLKFQSAQFAKIETSVKCGHIVNFIQELCNFEYVTGVASLQSGLLAVIDFTGNQVFIYEKQNSKYEKKLSLELNTSNENKPYGVMFCPDGKLWVARWTDIEVYSPAGKYEKTISTMQDDDPDTAVGVYSFAITKDGSMIMSGNFERNVLTFHDPTGKIIRTLKTGIRPCKMAVIKDTHVALSDWMAGKVSVMDIETGLETLCVDIPNVNSMCYDNQTDCFFIGSFDPCEDEPSKVRTGTGKIEQYCWRTGRKLACIARRLEDPTAMTVTSGNTFAVADDKSVKIFEIA